MRALSSATRQSSTRALPPPPSWVPTPPARRVTPRTMASIAAFAERLMEPRLRSSSGERSRRCLDTGCDMCGLRRWLRWRCRTVTIVSARWRTTPLTTAPSRLCRSALHQIPEWCTATWSTTMTAGCGRCWYLSTLRSTARAVLPATGTPTEPLCVSWFLTGGLRARCFTGTPPRCRCGGCSSRRVPSTPCPRPAASRRHASGRSSIG
mmetsp:Transcript_951/g.3159  ORF Transcript_951/g.3159 Transcript_951/m.3159 type:complete len:208 (-) Transcript_951:109-732(-)